MNSSMVSTIHFSLHKNVNERGTSNPPEGICDACILTTLEFRNFSIFNKKINIARDFSYHLNLFLRHYGGQLKTLVDQEAGEKINCKE